MYYLSTFKSYIKDKIIKTAKQLTSFDATALLSGLSTAWALATCKFGKCKLETKA